MKSFAEETTVAEVLISGLKSNSERAAKRGLDKDFIPTLETILNEIRNIHNEHEALQAKLHIKTQELNDKRDKMKELTDEARKVVKLEFDKTQWKEFGIDDKR